VSLATKGKVHTTDLLDDKVSLVVFSSFRSSEVRSPPSPLCSVSETFSLTLFSARRSTSTALCDRRSPT